MYIKTTSVVTMVTPQQLYEYYQFVMACLESDSCVTVVKATKEWPRR